jgi:hypothetical protein
VSGVTAVDVLVVGGGVAGLWVVDELVRAGYRALLVEREAFGSGQTVCAQGIVHGGLKYTLTGGLTESARAIREMPDVWRGCLRGEREPDLSSVEVAAEHCYLWRTSSLMSQVGMIGARAGLRTKPLVVKASERPAALVGSPGEVFRVDEQVVDMVSLLAGFSERLRGCALKIDADAGVEFGPGGDVTIRSEGLSRRLRPTRVVMTAGSGNEAMRRIAGLSDDIMQRRPLHMSLLRGDLPGLFGHCADGAKTRVTITTSYDSAGRRVWQVGGQLAEDGVSLEGDAFRERVGFELKSALPGVDFSDVAWSSYRVDRAEGRTGGGGRPAGVQVHEDGHLLTAWPTKMALAPVLAHEILRRLGSMQRIERGMDVAWTADWPAPPVAQPPWERALTWRPLL